MILVSEDSTRIPRLSLDRFTGIRLPTEDGVSAPLPLCSSDSVKLEWKDLWITLDMDPPDIPPQHLPLDIPYPDRTSGPTRIMLSKRTNQTLRVLRFRLIVESDPELVDQWTLDDDGYLVRTHRTVMIFRRTVSSWHGEEEVEEGFQVWVASEVQFSHPARVTLLASATITLEQTSIPPYMTDVSTWAGMSRVFGDDRRAVELSFNPGMEELTKFASLTIIPYGFQFS